MDVSIPAVAHLGGYQLLVVAVTGPIVCAVSRKFGKRPVFLFSALMGCIGTIIGGCANDYKLLLVGRIVQGFSTSAFESIVVTVIGDIYFVHERGFRMSLLTCTLGAVTGLVSVITGPITTNLGWKYCFWVLLPFCAVQLILMYIFCPETSYNRAAIDDTDTDLRATSEGAVAIKSSQNADLSNDDNKASGRVTVLARTGSSGPRKSFFAQHASRVVFYCEDSFFRLLFAPFIVLTNFAVLWTIVMSGLIVGCYASVSFIIAQWFSASPYDYDAAHVGYLWVGPTVGGFFACLFMSIISDPMVKFCAKMNKGIYEPEFRLFPMVISFVFTVAGLALYGHGLQQYWNPAVTSVFLGIMLFGILVGFISSSAYALDAFRGLSDEIFVMSMMFKNLIFYGTSRYVNNWIAGGGPMQMFGTFAGISAFLILLGVPIYVWGKWYRSFWDRYNMMRITGFKV